MAGFYHIKDFSKVSEENRIDFSHTLDLLDFLPLVHKTNIKCFMELNKDDKTKNMLADLVASVMAQLQESRFFTDRFIEIGLSSCRDVLSDRGYELSFMKHLNDNLDHQKEHIIFVAGCQVKEMLFARVDAALQIIRGLEVPFKIVFCGKNPGTNKVRMYKESREMEAYFNVQLETNPINSSYRTFKVEVDERSHSTATNVEEFLKKEGVIDTDKMNSVFIASSLFHLLRLSKEFEKQLEGNKKRQSIDRLILCGAENSLQISDVARSRGYVKAMMFDLVSYMIDSYMIESNDG